MTLVSLCLGYWGLYIISNKLFQFSLHIIYPKFIKQGFFNIFGFNRRCVAYISHHILVVQSWLISCSSTISKFTNSIFGKAILLNSSRLITSDWIDDIKCISLYFCRRRCYDISAKFTICYNILNCRGCKI